VVRLPEIPAMRRDDEDRDYDDRDDDFNQPPRRQGMSGVLIAVIVVIAVGMIVVPLVLVGLLLPAVGKVREAAARSKDVNNMKQTVIGLHNYNDGHQGLPGPYAAKRNGKPNPGLSWRVEILPYIEQEPLYRRFNPDQSWDSPANKPASDAVVVTYLSSSDPPDNQTRFRAFVGPGTAFEDDTVGIPRGFPDGTSNTLLFVETADKVPWASPQDIPYQPGGALPALGHPGRSTFIAAMADGSVMMLNKNISPAVLHAIITRNGNEALPPGWNQ
jgi:hypothetical protein